MEDLQTINFAENFNGKLLLDVFGTVRPYDQEVHIKGKEFKVLLNKVCIGTATLETFRTFEFREIRDVLSYLDIGQEPYVLAGKIKLWYPEITFFGEETMAHLVFKFTSRVKEATEDLLIDRQHNFLLTFFIDELDPESPEFG